MKSIASIHHYVKSTAPFLQGLTIVNSGVDFIEYAFINPQPDTNYYFVGINFIEEYTTKNGAYSLNTKTTTGFRFTYLDSSVAVGDPDWPIFMIVREDGTDTLVAPRLNSGEIDTFISIRNGVVKSKSHQFSTIEFFTDRIKINFTDTQYQRGNPIGRMAFGKYVSSPGKTPILMQVLGSEKIGINSFVIDFGGYIEIYIKYINGSAFDNTNASINLTQFYF